MSVTQHLVQDSKDARIIHDKVTGESGGYEHKEENYFFCLMDDGRYVGYSIALPLSPGRYLLSEMDFLDKYRHQNRAVNLLNYMLFELQDAGVGELLVDTAALEPGPELDTFLASRNVQDFEGKKLIKTAPKKDHWHLFRRAKSRG